jgi:hypothetical protein
VFRKGRSRKLGLPRLDLRPKVFKTGANVMEGQEGHGLVEAKPVISALYLRDFKVAGGLHLRCA